MINQKEKSENLPASDHLDFSLSSSLFISGTALIFTRKDKTLSFMYDSKIIVCRTAIVESQFA